MKTMIKPSLFLFAVLIALPVYAHHPMGGQTPATFVQGMLSGFGHPIIGIDHFAFILMIGLLASALSGISRYLVPVAFIAATVVGTGLHLATANLPASELVIAFSVISAGTLVLLRKQLSSLLLALGVAGFGVFHGYAYGEAIIGAETTPLVTYLISFSFIQYAIILAIAMGMEKMAARSQRLQQIATRSAASVATLIGVIFVALNLA